MSMQDLFFFLVDPHGLTLMKALNTFPSGRGVGHAKNGMAGWRIVSPLGLKSACLLVLKLLGFT